MTVKAYNTVVVMPDNSRLEVDYYCKDSAENKMKLVIQLHDCICTLLIDKSLCKDAEALETMVHNKVINTKGHLC